MAFSNMVQTLDRGVIASSNFCCSLTKFQSAATYQLPSLFSIKYLAKFFGRFHLNSSCFGAPRNLLKSAYSSSSFSETSLSLSPSSLCFLRFLSGCIVAENPYECSEVFFLAVFSASVSLTKLVSLVPQGIPSL